MCGRFAAVTPVERLTALFAVTNVPPDRPPRWNIAPPQEILAVRFNPASRQRSLDALRWGLIPHRVADPGGGPRPINARAESLTDKPFFRDAFRHRRCLIPADAVYEWKAGSRPKQPVAIRPRHGGVFALAGLWENWRAPDGTWIRTCAIITTPANATVAGVHPRMPAILDETLWAGWLGEERAAPDDIQAMLRPCPDDAIVVYPVGPRVNDPRNDGADLLAPLAGAGVRPHGDHHAESTFPLCRSW